MAKYNTGQIVESVKSHPFNLDHITLESGLSWPVPVVKDDKLLLSFFYYPAGGPRGNWQIGSPYYRAVADPDSIEDIQFTRVEPKDFGVNIPRGQSLGRLEDHTGYLEGVTSDQRAAMIDQLYALTDEILPLYLKPVPSLSNDEKSAVVEYYSLFQRLTLNPLWPVYKGVNPEFFNWVEAIIKD